MVLVVVFFFLTAAAAAERDIFILGGQSNMVGMGGIVAIPNTTAVWDGVVPPESEPNPLILTFNGSWEEAKEPLHGFGIGPGLPFAHSLLEKVNPPGTTEIGLIPCAVGGTSILLWARGSALYNTTVSRAREAAFSGGVIRGLLWYQGESDANVGGAKFYKQRLQQFLSDIRADLMIPSLPVIEVAVRSGEPVYLKIVRESQIQTAAEVPIGLQVGPDNLHLTTAAQVQLGKMMADAYWNWTVNGNVSGDGHVGKG